MDYDRYFGLSTSSRNYQSTLKSQFDICIDFEDIEEEEEEVKGEYRCPFCSEDFDLNGLCCHFDDEHSVEAKSGVCPVCLMKVGMNMVGHTQHGNFSNSWHKLKPHKGDSHAAILSLRKELQNGHVQSLLDRPSSSISTSQMTADPWLSFIYSTPTADVSESVQPDTVTGERAENKRFYEKTSEIPECLCWIVSLILLPSCGRRNCECNNNDLCVKSETEGKLDIYFVNCGAKFVTAIIILFTSRELIMEINGQDVNMPQTIIKGEVKYEMASW